MALAFRFHKIRPQQNPHMVRNRGLREFHALFNIEGTEASFLSDGGPALLLERTQNAAARRVANGMQKAIESGTC